MQKQLTKKEELNKSLRLDNNYTTFLKDIKNLLKTAQIRAALAANSELIRFYWQLGTDKNKKLLNGVISFLNNFLMICGRLSRRCKDFLKET